MPKWWWYQDLSRAPCGARIFRGCHALATSIWVLPLRAGQPTRADEQRTLQLDTCFIAEVLHTRRRVRRLNYGPDTVSVRLICREACSAILRRRKVQIALRNSSLLPNSIFDIAEWSCVEYTLGLPIRSAARRGHALHSSGNAQITVYSLAGAWRHKRFVALFHSRAPIILKRYIHVIPQENRARRTWSVVVFAAKFT